MSAPRTVTLAFTGASGMPFGLRLLECLVAARCQVHLVPLSRVGVHDSSLLATEPRGHGASRRLRMRLAPPADAGCPA